MSLGGRALLLAQQLKDKNAKKCIRCQSYYNYKHENCQHCNGLNERQVEELIKNNQKIYINNSIYCRYYWGNICCIHYFISEPFRELF